VQHGRYPAQLAQSDFAESADGRHTDRLQAGVVAGLRCDGGPDLSAGRESSVLNIFSKCLTLLTVCGALTGCQSTGFWQQRDLLKKADNGKIDCAPDKPGCGPDGADCAPDAPQRKNGFTVPDLKGLSRDADCQDGACVPRDQVSAGQQGCSTGCNAGCQACDFGLPRELKKVSLPDYVIEPPDVLLIEVNGSRRIQSMELSTGELLDMRVDKTLPVDQVGFDATRVDVQINGTYQIQSDGQIDLGPGHGKVAVRDLLISDARRLIELHLRRTLHNPRVYVSRATGQDEQHISGEHLVRPDGTVSLGTFGSIYVAGSTLSQVERVIERHVSGRLLDPRINLDVLACNSKVYYVVTSKAGAGEQVFRFPSTGNETVLDAIAQTNGAAQLGPKKRVWIARPAPPSLGYEQVLEVDWDAIVRGAQTCTNYQILPGDRVYVRADGLTLAQ